MPFSAQQEVGYQRKAWRTSMANPANGGDRVQATGLSISCCDDDEGVKKHTRTMPDKSEKQQCEMNALSSWPCAVRVWIGRPNNVHAG